MAEQNETGEIQIQRRRKVSGLIFNHGGQVIIDMPVAEATDALNKCVELGNDIEVFDGPQGDHVGVRASDISFVVELEVAPAVPGLQTPEPVIAGPGAMAGLPPMPGGR